MIIEKHRTGAHQRKTIYTLCNSIADTGADRTEEIARFDTLEMAVIVLRYINGDELSEADTYRAKEAIKKSGRAHRRKQTRPQGRLTSKGKPRPYALL